MNDTAKPSQLRLTLTIMIDGEQTDIDIDPNKKIRDVIRHALVAFDVQEDANRCHLAGPDRLYLPNQAVRDINADTGAFLSLRLPF